MGKKRIKKFLKIFFIVLLIIIILFLINTLINFMIIKKIQQNIKPYLASTNYHIKSVATEENGTVITMNYYEKDGKQTMIMERNLNGEIITMSMYNNGERTDIFYDTPEEKTVQLNAETTIWFKIFDCVETDNDWQTFIGSMTTNIRKTKYNEKECYVVSDFMSPNFMSGNEKDEFYIEKDTGLYVKANIGNEVTEREYEFDNVKDEIFVEPDIGQYTIKENK